MRMESPLNQRLRRSPPDVVYTPIDVTSSPLLLSYRLYDTRLPSGVDEGAASILAGWSLIVGIVSVVVVVLSVFNFPKEGPFEEELVITFGPQTEQDAWDRLVGLTADGDSEANRDAALDILANTAISIPERPLLFDTLFPMFVAFSDLGESGTQNVEELLGQVEVDRAYEEYLRLWTIAHNMVAAQGPITLIQYLIGVGLGVSLSEFYLDPEGVEIGTLPIDERLLEVTGRMDVAVSHGFAKGMAAEYRAVKDTLVESAEETCDQFGFTGSFLGVCFTEMPWPFYDKNKTLRTVHDLYAKAVAVSQEPAYGRRDQMLEEAREEFDAVARWSFWTDPVGSAFLAAVVPQIVGFAGRHDPLKSRLAIMRWAIAGAQSGDYSDVPIDPMTGQPFRVTDKGATLEVETESESDEGEPIKYEIKKALSG